MSSTSWRTRWSEQLQARDKAGLLRSALPLKVQDALHAVVKGRACVLFSTNDYLGMGLHPTVLAAWRAAPGPGPRGSARVCGHTETHEALEAALAAHLRKERALLFPTGFAANVSVLEALAGPDVDFYSDALNHASIVDGLRLARRRGARVHIYPHADVEALSQALRTARGRCVLVTDSVFSMDGDIAPLQELADLRDQHDALLVVDEAHGSLILGEHGRGACEAMGVLDRVDLVVGTLSKAFAAQGGYVAGDNTAVSWILNVGRAGVYSTALPLPAVHAASAALAVAESAEGERARERLRAYREAVEPGGEAHLSTPIVAMILGTPERAMHAADTLWRQGLHVVGIRPPTVPEGTARLRISLSAGHQPDEVDRLRDALASLRRQGY